MKTLKEIFVETNQGETIVKMANELGFESARLLSYVEKTPCLVLDFDRLEHLPDAVKKSSILQVQLAERLKIKVIVLDSKSISTEGRQLMSNYDITLPANNQEILNKLFGDTEKFEVDSLDDDKSYQRKHEVDIEIFSPTKQGKELTFQAKIQETKQPNGKINGVNGTHKTTPEGQTIIDRKAKFF